MASSREESLFVDDDDDEIVEIITSSRTPNAYGHAHAHSNTIGGLILPVPEGQTPPGFNTTQPGDPWAQVIDLTEEPDSPVRDRRSTSNTRSSSSRHQSRNPRRTNSQRVSPPRLARSDSTFFPAPAAGVIDLTADSPEDSRPSDSTRSRTAAHHNHHHHHHRDRPRPDELIELEFISSVPRARPAPAFAIGLTRRLAGILGADIIGFPAPQLDVSRNAFAPRAPSPKPPMEPIAPAREGFTRDTCVDPETDSETIVICPACNEELAYDPAGPVHSSPTGGRKRKRAPGEHHFWALKKCGHVYCADCFENRRPTKANPDGVGFRGPEGKCAYQASAAELKCAVDGCETKVSAKGEWVGIFL